eukprot:39861_1
MSAAFMSSHELPFCVGLYIPKPSQDPTNKNCIIISTYYDEKQTTAGIYKYNLVSNESQIIYKYNNTFNNAPYYHGQFVDTSNNTLILYGGYYDTFKVFDLIQIK